MSYRTAISPDKKNAVHPASGPAQHTAVRSIPEHSMLSTARTSSSLGHDFSRIPTQTTASLNGTQSAASCTLSPRTCPFGGACHTCPVTVQAKLTIGQPGDKYEQEADRVAEQVMRMPDPRLQRQVAPEEEEGQETIQPKPVAAQITPLLQRQFESEEEEEEEEEEETIQAKQAGEKAPEVGPSLTTQIRALRGGGRSLSPSVRNFFEPRFGYDFSQVRIHNSARTAETVREANAQAFTTGRSIVFGAGQYAPQTITGKRLLAHELVHTIQQTGGTLQSELVGQTTQGSTASTGSGTSPTPSFLQRQEGPSEEENEETSQEALVPEFGSLGTEPGCPRRPTNLGRLQPAPPCPEDTRELEGEPFRFCADSDVFVNAAEQARLRTFARNQRTNGIFTIHGYASWEGRPGYNLNLSCHRAKRAARELINAGVRSEQIRIAAKGRTRRFGSRRRDRPNNRVALIHVASSITAPSPAGAPANRRGVVDRAVARIRAGDYRLAADAYLSFWTCGRVPSLAEMVRRTTIRVEGESRLARINRSDLLANARLGGVLRGGLREIVLSNETFDEATDPVGCAMARIIDMAAHHFIAPQIPPGRSASDPLVHRAALFLVELAGVAPCRSPAQTDPSDPSLILIPAQQWWSRLARDPLRGQRPPCADRPLPGPTQPLRQPPSPAVPPSFSVDRFDAVGGRGRIHPLINERRNSLQASSPRGAFHFTAAVSAIGDPIEVSHYQVGFLQTIVADETVVEFVGGQAVHLNLPVPIRDGPPRNLDAPPWFMPPLVSTLEATGPSTTQLSDSPSMGMPFSFVNPELLRRVRQPRDLVQEGNVVNRARNRTTFHTWVVARHDDAPLDRFSTHFLDGRTVTWAMDVDVVGRQATGTYHAGVSPGPPPDTASMQLRGPTPGEIDPLLRTTEVTRPTPRAQAGGLNLQQFRERVRQVAGELAPLRTALGLTGRMMVRVRVNPETGRLIIHTSERPAVTISRLDDGRGSEQAPRRLAREFLIRLRKDLILGPLSRDVARVPIPTVIRPLASRGAGSRGSENPLSPEHGIGLVGYQAEQEREQRSARQMREHPEVYDPDFWPRVEVEMERERYFYDFTVSGINIDQVCRDPSLRTQGCVTARVDDPNFTVRVRPDYRQQSLDRETFNSPVGLRVTTFPITFILYTPREDPGGSTLNHELHHLVMAYDFVNTYKDRLARRVQARLRQARQLAAETPKLKDTLLARGTLLEIVRQEEARFRPFFLSEYQARQHRIHEQEARTGLQPVQIPRTWTNFSMPAIRPGMQGTFAP